MNQIQDRPSGTWQVTDPGQQVIAYAAGGSHAEARAVVRHRPDLRDIVGEAPRRAACGSMKPPPAGSGPSPASR